MSEAEMKRGAALPGQPHLADSGLLGSSKSTASSTPPRPNPQQPAWARAIDPRHPWRVVLGRWPGDDLAATRRRRGSVRRCALRGRRFDDPAP